MGMIQCLAVSPCVCGTTGIASAVAGCCVKVPQSKWRSMTQNVMIACTVIFAISTTILFTLSNPGASGGPATQRPLSNQASNIGLVMGITFSVPLVLSVVYPIYGSQCCQDTKDQQLPSEDGQEAPSQFNRYVVAIGIIHWGIFLFGVGFIVFGWVSIQQHQQAAS